MTFHIYPAWGSEAESETHIFFENGKQQKHTALPSTTKTHSPPRYRAVPFEKRNVNPYATYEGESKRDRKNVQWPNHEDGTPLSLLFQARSTPSPLKEGQQVLNTTTTKSWIRTAANTHPPLLDLMEQQGSMTTAGSHESPHSATSLCGTTC